MFITEYLIKKLLSKKNIWEIYLRCLALFGLVKAIFYGNLIRYKNAAQLSIINNVQLTENKTLRENRGTASRENVGKHYKHEERRSIKQQKPLEELIKRTQC